MSNFKLEEFQLEEIYLHYLSLSEHTKNSSVSAAAWWASHLSMYLESWIGSYSGCLALPATTPLVFNVLAQTQLAQVCLPELEMTSLAPTADKPKEQPKIQSCPFHLLTGISWDLLCAFWDFLSALNHHWIQWEEREFSISKGHAPNEKWTCLYV